MRISDWSSDVCSSDLLDLGLSDIDGFVLLDLLKHDPQTSHIPIHVVSGADEASAVLDMGALGVTATPAGHDELSRVFGALAEQVRRDERRLLIVGGTAADRKKSTNAVAGTPRPVATAPPVAKAPHERGSSDGTP